MTVLSEQVGGDHYKRNLIQPIEFIHANRAPFIEGNCIKYLMRHREKGARRTSAKSSTTAGYCSNWSTV